MTRIATLLDACGKPDWQVASECGIHPSVISRYRSGERRPHARHAQLLAEYFQVDTIADAVTVPQTDTIDDPLEWVD